MTSPVSIQREGSIAIIAVNNPPVNALGHAVRMGITTAVEKLSERDDVKAIVLACEGRTFFAGADITEFGKPPKDPWLPDMLRTLDECPKLTVAALHGTAFGGGFETALCCNYRLAVESAKVGLPESKLGLLPGAGGTQRLPRLVGAEKALDMMISGKPIDALAAFELGIVDKISDNPDVQKLTNAAVTYTQRLLVDRAPQRRVSELKVKPVAADFFGDYRQSIARKTRGLEAPERIIQCVEAAIELPFDEGLKRERELFSECLQSPQSAALRHMFFAERAAGKVPGVTRDTPRRQIKQVGVIGAGTMGAGIALACMNAGLPVTLLDVSSEAVDRGEAHIYKLLEAMVKKGRIDAATRDQRIKLLTTDTQYQALADDDLIIEAVFESMEIKQQVFTQLDQVAKPGAILATNTSTLDVDAIAASTKRSGDVIGLHFFSPANIMRLLEIVRGKDTADDVIATSLALAKGIGKLGVVVGNCFGFVGNRMLYGYGRENQFLLLEGAAPETIDQALFDWGMAMGPNAVGDLAGLDVGYKVRKERTDLPDDPRYYRIATKLAQMGRYGQKTGAGMFRYEEGSRKPISDPVVDRLIRAEAESLGIQQRQIGAEEIVERCIYALVIVGAQLLEEGIASKPSDIDVVWANGYGFPAWRGGPMHYADTVGLHNIVAKVRQFAAAHGDEYWPVPPLLERLATDNSSFAEYQQSL